jgi:hypothetical protein
MKEAIFHSQQNRNVCIHGSLTLSILPACNTIMDFRGVWYLWEGGYQNFLHELHFFVGKLWLHCLYGQWEFCITTWGHIAQHHTKPCIYHLKSYLRLASSVQFPSTWTAELHPEEQTCFTGVKIAYKPMPRFVFFFFRVCNIKLTHSHVDYVLCMWDFAAGFRIGVTFLSESF